MPTRSDLERTASCWALALKEDRPSASVLRSFQQASTRIRRHCVAGASHYVFEKGSDKEVQVRNCHRPVGWCAARKFFKQAVADEDLWCSVKVAEVPTDAVGAGAAASGAIAASERSSRGADASIEPEPEECPASSSTAWNPAPPLKQRRLSDPPALQLEDFMPCCQPQELIPKTLRLLQSDRPTAGAYNFEGSEVLGSGQYGRVESATLTQTNTPVAIKMIRLDEDGVNSRTAIVREVSILREVHGHPNVVELLDFVTIEPRFEYGLVLKRAVCLDTLRTFINPKCFRALPLWDDECVHIASGCAGGLAYVHSLRIFHSDLKPSNVVIAAAWVDFTLASQRTGPASTDAVDVGNRSGSDTPALAQYLAEMAFDTQAQLADFGNACWMAPADQPPTREDSEEFTTLWYRAPEIAFGTKAPEPAADVWSLGATVWELALGEPPFLIAQQSIYALLHKILSRKGPAPIELKSQWPHAINTEEAAKPLPATWSPSLKHFLNTATDLRVIQRSSADAAERALQRTYYLTPTIGPHGAVDLQGERGKSFFQAARMQRSILQYLREDPGLKQVEADMLAQRLEPKTCMSESERAFKDEVVYSMCDDGQEATFCGQKVLGRCPCRRMRAFNNILLDHMRSHFDQLWAKLGRAYQPMGDDELGVGGKHLFSTPPRRWAGRMATYQAMEWADIATKIEKDHFDGGGSSIHFGSGLYGPRELRLGWHHPSGDIPNKHSPLEERLTEAIMQEPGDIYCSNMAAVYHQVVHRQEADKDHKDRESWYLDGQPRKLAVMLRSNTFPGIARTTKNPPAPAAVWNLLCDELASIFTAQEIKLPMLHEILQEHDRLERWESAEAAGSDKKARRKQRGQ